MRWVIPPRDDAQAGALVRELSLHPVAAQVLVSRGFGTPEAATDLLKDGLSDLPDPFLMKGMDRAVARLVRALAAREKITLYGDYDVDGVTSIAVLATFLRDAGAAVATYIPNRIDEGYGVNAEAIRRIAADGTRLLVTLDCGISSVAEMALAKELGLEVVVVDHHQPGPALPEAVAILNPHQAGCPFPTKHLCAAGIAFLLAVALRKGLRDTGAWAGRREPNLRELLDLVALGTIADVVPLLGANRILVRHGLVELARARRPGVRALKTMAGLSPSAEVTSGQVAFRLAPRINAAGRLADAAAGVELLTTSDEARAGELAAELDLANTERQGIERKILDEAMAQAEKLGGEAARGLVLANEGWHPGVVGIVASRVAERFHRPTVVVALDGDEGRGSGRSIEGFHLYEALAKCAGHLIRFGGHKHAAGLSVSKSSLSDFRAAFEGLARATIPEEQLVPRCRVDAVVRPAEIDASLAEALGRLAPFGAGNPEPVLAAMGLSAQPRVLASKKGGAGHLKLSIEGARALDVIGFGFEDRATLAGAPFDAAFHVGIDEWNGARRVSLKLKDLRKSG